MKRFLKGHHDSGDENFLKREMRGINAMTFKALKNPARSIREIRDIVSYRILEPIQLLQSVYGYDFYFFLNAGDCMVPSDHTLQCIADVVPPQNVKVVPGGHNDLLFQRWQRPAFLSFVEEIRRKTTSMDEPPRAMARTASRIKQLMGFRALGRWLERQLDQYDHQDEQGIVAGFGEQLDRMSPLVGFHQAHGRIEQEPDIDGCRGQ